VHPGMQKATSCSNFSIAAGMHKIERSVAVLASLV
jgi:hypothetical protein